MCQVECSSPGIKGKVEARSSGGRMLPGISFTLNADKVNWDCPKARLRLGYNKKTITVLEDIEGLGPPWALLLHASNIVIVFISQTTILFNYSSIANF